MAKQTHSSDAEGWIRGFPNYPSLEGSAYWGVSSEESSPMDALFIQASVSLAEIPITAN